MNPVNVARALFPLIEFAIERAAAKPNVPIAPAQTKPVTAAVVKELSEMPEVAAAMKPKKWWQSITVLSGIGVVLAAGGTIAGYQVSTADVQEFVMHGTALVTGVLGIFAIIGRIRANRSIGK